MSQLDTKAPRIILWDIETLPNFKEVMKVFPGLSAYPGLTLKATISSIICVGWKVLGEKRVNVISAWDFKTRWRKNVNDDYSVVKAAYDVLKDADCIVTHNGKRFDWKHLQTRLIANNLPTLPKIPHIDTCSEAKKHLLSFNNRLNTLADLMADEKKMEHEGWELWTKVLNKNHAAMIKMEKYCQQDVIVLEKIFKRLRPLMSGLPNYNAFLDPLGKSCPNCGSHTLIKDGTKTRTNGIFQAYMCKDCLTTSQIKIKTHSKCLKQV